MNDLDVYAPKYESEDADNWLVSYADLLTNLLAFFVLLFAISKVQPYRLEMVRRHFEQKATTGSIADLKKNLDNFITQNHLEQNLETSLDDQGLAIRFKTQVLFDEASADLSPSGENLLVPVSNMVHGLSVQYEVVVEGYADDLPIHTAQFASNWELSAQRGVRVVKKLIDSGVQRDRISAQAFADTRPIDNESETDLAKRRALNRRVVVRVR